MTTSRRDFVRNLSLASAGFLTAAHASATRHVDPATATQTFIIPTASPTDRVKLAIIGTGFRGQSHLGLALRRSDVDIVAICDVDDVMLKSAKAAIEKSGKPMPKVFTGSNYAYRDLLAAKGIDAVIIATPWEWHTPMVLELVKCRSQIRRY